MSNRSLANLLQTMTPAVRQSPLRALFLAVAVALCGLMTVADLPSPAPVHAQEQQVTPTKESTGAASPERPTDLEASASHDSVSLTWTASTDDTVTHYAVLRRDRDADASGVFHVIDSNAGPATSYTDDSVSAEGSYVYRVKAVSPTGVSQWSSYARADTPPDPADLAPSGLSAKAVSGDDGVIEGVALAWDAPAEDAASVTGYEILRAVGDGELATLVADTGSTDTSHTDATATEAGESYAYRVKALRGEEASQPSDRAEAIIPKVTVQPSEPPISDRQNVETTAWVSNTAQTLSSGSIALGNRDKRHSQGFSTGAEPGGYSLGSVGVYVRDEDLESGETFTVHIYTADATGAIDTLVHTLISPDSYADDAVNLFTAPADATLAANTDYLVVFEATGNSTNDFELGLTHSPSEDSGSATGWSIEDERHFDNSNHSGSFVISVNAGTAVTSTDATLSALSLSGVTLSPSFAADTLAYTASVGSAVDSTTVTATANDGGATLAILPADADAATDGHQVALAVGDTAVSVTVTAEDGTTTQTYTVTVARADAAPTVSSVAVTSDPGADETYAPGDTIQVTVTFD